MSEKAGFGDRQGAAVARAVDENVEFIGVPRMAADFVCWAKDNNGNNYVVWEDRIPSNVVVNQGRQHVANRLFASATRSTAGCGLFLHSATLGSGNVWSGISASQVVSYGNSIPAVTFAETWTNASDTGTNSLSCSASYGFNASTQTVSGCGIVFYTSASMGTNLASADARLYCYGTFTGGSQQVQNGNTLSATLTLSFVTV
jgi:hypothetical protein